MKLWKTLLAAAATCAVAFCPALPAGAAADNLADSDITLAVETELIVEEAVPSHKIDVSTDGGIVTLSGSVDSYYAKLEAERTAESVKGVLAVVNNINVTPITRLDSNIRADVVSTLIADPVTESFEIDVEVENGIVTLSGEVDSYTEKSVAEEIAQDVMGVVDVNNNITYDVVSNRTDEDIKADIKYRLRSDASIDAGLITVKVDEGDVTLQGSTGSAAEKSEAETDAWTVPGVRSVANNLEVKYWLDGGTAAWSDGWTDADMQQAIENALTVSPRVNASNVLATVEDGVATLTGTVDNLLARREAEQEADEVLGVWRVKNFVRVRPRPNRSDTEIANDIRGALDRNPTVDRYEIRVSVYNGEAHLRGEVDSQYMKNAAEKAAARVHGVVSIQNHLDVDYEPVAKTDQEIEEDIRSQLWWSPFVDSDDIVVEVHAGVATLMGSVEDWDEFEAAKENAREGGATSVISKLKIENGFWTG